MSFWLNRPQTSGSALIPKYSGSNQDPKLAGHRRAFVILIGWIGATEKQLQKFTAIYKTLGYGYIISLNWMDSIPINTFLFFYRIDVL